MLSGIEAATVFVEVDVTSGLPSFSKAGFPDSTVHENRDRLCARPSASRGPGMSGSTS
jgi:predicted ATPase with chaperone activity